MRPRRGGEPRRLRDLLKELAEESPVVVLQPPLPADDHVHWEPPSRNCPNRRPAAAADNLAVQSALVARAEKLVATYGGFAYLGPYLGIPARRDRRARRRESPARGRPARRLAGGRVGADRASTRGRIAAMIVATDELHQHRGAVTMVDGGFDPLHPGHIAYFRAAEALGLPVLCNISADEWVARKHRPLLDPGRARRAGRRDPPRAARPSRLVVHGRRARRAPPALLREGRGLARPAPGGGAADLRGAGDRGGLPGHRPGLVDCDTRSL